MRPPRPARTSRSTPRLAPRLQASSGRVAPLGSRRVVGALAGVALVAVLVGGCRREQPERGAPGPARTSPAASVSPRERVTTPADRTRTAAETAPPPSSPAEPSGAPEVVVFPTSDGVSISATLRRGRPGTVPVVLVHQLGSTRAEWEPLVARLAAEGLTTLAIDLRGHGASTAIAGPRPRTLVYGAFRDEDWRATAKDVRAAIDHLAGLEGLAGLQGPDARSIVLIGSSIGGTACLAAAAEDPRAVRVVVLSPGRAYRGFDAIVPASRLGERELLVLRATDEAMSQETGEVLDRIVTRSTLRLVPGVSHGVAMFADDPSQLDAVVAFVLDAQPH